MCEVQVRGAEDARRDQRDSVFLKGTHFVIDVWKASHRYRVIDI